MGRPKVAERLVGVGGEDESLLLGLQALADPVRLQMVRLLGEQEQCICHLTEAFGLSQASVSYHMAALKRAGLVHDRRDARWTYYRLAPEAIALLRRAVDDLLEVETTVLAGRGCCDSAVDGAQSLYPQPPTSLGAQRPLGTQRQGRCH